jgi:hypothetical protein
VGPIAMNDNDKTASPSEESRPEGPRTTARPTGESRRRPLSRDEALAHLRQGAVGRLAITAGALPFIEVVRYCLIGETIYVDDGSSDMLDAAAGNVVAFESGNTDAGSHQDNWSVCAVGVAMPNQTRVEHGILQLHPELVTGWSDAADRAAQDA